MDDNADQQHLLQNSSHDQTNIEIVEANPLIEIPTNEIQEQKPTEDFPNWDTSLLCQACREGNIELVGKFIEYSLQTIPLRERASEIADRLDDETGLSPLHHAARYQQLHVCLMLLSHITMKLGVNIKDANDQTPIHAAFRLSNNLHKDDSNQERPFDIEKDLGDKILETEVWQDEYNNKIFENDHPLIYLFVKANGNVNARDKYLLTPLHYAVARNNFNGVKQLIKSNADIKAADRQGIRPLHLACKEGYLSIAEYLIEQGARIDVADADAYTPLHYACVKGHLDIIKLIKSKDERNFQNFLQLKTTTGSSCLHLAVQHEDIQSVEYILSQFTGDTLKVLINDQVESFGTPLHIAAKFCDSAMIDLLYENGADPLILNSHNQSALHIASIANRSHAVEKLLSLTQTSLLEMKDHRGQTALSVTTSLNIVEQLIKAGADISSVDNNNMNVLMLAVSNLQSSIVDHLFSAINDQLFKVYDQVTKRDKRTIFLLAIQTGSIDMCALLLTNPNIRWNQSDKKRMNAFHIAARNDYPKLIEFLSEEIKKLDKSISTFSRSFSITRTNSELVDTSQPSPTLGLYINAQNEDGKTPLHIAAENGFRSCVQILLKYHADTLLPNYLGQIPLHVAVQNGHGSCVELLIKASTRNLGDFQTALSRKQSLLITACQNGFADIVRLLLSENIGIDYDDDNDEEENPLEVAIKCRQVETIHVLLEHSCFEDWLKPVRNTEYYHQTPLRDLIRYMPECAKHVFDKLVVKTNETDSDGNTFERTTYNYEFIDDYFVSPDEDKVYSTSGNQLYRNHPFIIALDSEHHFLLEHPLAQQLILRKWKLYRPVFYSTRILTFLLLVFLTFYVLVVPAPTIKSSDVKTSSLIKHSIVPLQWTIMILAALNLLKLILETILYRGLRVPFAQLFGMISFLTSIIAFIPNERTGPVIHWQWQLASLSTLLQWFNVAFILRSVPFVGNVIVMFQSVILNFFSLTFVILPLLIAFTIASKMVFFNHSAFVTIIQATHKLSAMLLGEFDYEPLFFSRPILTAAILLFIPFILIMAVVFMNLLLGLTIGDIQTCMENARAKANAYRTRELLYTEATLPSIKWLRLNTILCEYMDDDSVLKKGDESENEDNDYNEHTPNYKNFVELGKLLDILNMLCTQAKQVLQEEINLETKLKQLLTARQAQDSMTSSTSSLNTPVGV